MKNIKSTIKRGGCIDCSSCKRKCNLKNDEKAEKVALHLADLKKQKQKKLTRFIMKRRNYLESKIQELKKEMDSLAVINVKDVSIGYEWRFNKKLRAYEKIRGKRYVIERTDLHGNETRGILKKMNIMK
jgi:hypothetical protein